MAVGVAFAHSWPMFGTSARPQIREYGWSWTNNHTRGAAWRVKSGTLVWRCPGRQSVPPSPQCGRPGRGAVVSVDIGGVEVVRSLIPREICNRRQLDCDRGAGHLVQLATAPRKFIEPSRRGLFMALCLFVGCQGLVPGLCGPGWRRARLGAMGR